jgi:hypothetical protein
LAAPALHVLCAGLFYSSDFNTTSEKLVDENLNPKKLEILNSKQIRIAKRGTEESLREGLFGGKYFA